jgi:Leucine-rich repeat (LRR) protein
MSFLYHYCDVINGKLQCLPGCKLCNQDPPEIELCPVIITQDTQISNPIQSKYTLQLSSIGVTKIFLKNIFCNLRELYISNNPLRELCALPSVEILECKNCQLTTLPILLSNAKFIDCSNNVIRQLPSIEELPALETLYCSKNNIKTIPNYYNLKKLITSDNPISYIRSNTLEYLEAERCPLTSRHVIKGLIRRSPIIHKQNSIKYIIQLNEKIATPTLLDWYKKEMSAEAYYKLPSIIQKALLYLLVVV